MIKLSGVNKAFGDKKIFEDYNLTINDGEFVVFSGKSGCGKSTMLNMIGGLEPPDSGNIFVDEMDVYKRRNSSFLFTYKFGFLFQNFALVEDKTVKQNLSYVQKKARSGLSVEQILNELGIEDKISEKVYRLSGGEQQRVALARLMYKSCDIILADEPTGSLDSENANVVLKILHKLNDQGKTIILVTHDKTIIEREEKVINLDNIIESGNIINHS